jgi:hypothetical protein
MMREMVYNITGTEKGKVQYLRTLDAAKKDGKKRILQKNCCRGMGSGMKKCQNMEFTGKKHIGKPKMTWGRLSREI